MTVVHISPISTVARGSLKPLPFRHLRRVCFRKHWICLDSLSRFRHTDVDGRKIRPWEGLLSFKNVAPTIIVSPHLVPECCQGLSFSSSILIIIFKLQNGIIISINIEDNKAKQTTYFKENYLKHVQRQPYRQLPQEFSCRCTIVPWSPARTVAERSFYQSERPMSLLQDGIWGACNSYLIWARIKLVSYELFEITSSDFTNLPWLPFTSIPHT